jgi:acyl-CoA thioester hydrolase
MHELKEFPTVFSIPVQWGDQDSFGHVNNIMYFRWCETTRIYYLERVGLTRERFNGVGPILAHIGCNYRKPVTFPDTVHIGARVTKMGRSSFRMEHAIFSDALGLVAEADSTLVVYDYNTGKSAPIPDEVRLAISTLEKREF